MAMPSWAARLVGHRLRAGSLWALPNAAEAPSDDQGQALVLNVEGRMTRQPSTRTEPACPDCGHDVDHTTPCPDGCPLCPSTRTEPRTIATKTLLALGVPVTDQTIAVVEQGLAEVAAPGSRVDQAENPSASADAEGAGSLDVDVLADIWDRMHELFDFFPWYEADPRSAADTIAAEYDRLLASASGEAEVGKRDPGASEGGDR